MKLIQIDETQKELSEKVKSLYIDVFPKEERKPYALIEEKQREGKMQIWAIEMDKRIAEEKIGMERESIKHKMDFCGFAITILYQDMVLLDYFAICSEKRGNGIGSEVLRILKEKYMGRCLFLEIESTSERAGKLSKEEQQVRRKRKRFYHQNGITDTGLEVVLYGVNMEVLSAGRKIGFEEYLRFYVDTFGEKVADRIECVDNKRGNFLN